MQELTNKSGVHATEGGRGSHWTTVRTRLPVDPFAAAIGKCESVLGDVPEPSEFVMASEAEWEAAKATQGGTKMQEVRNDASGGGRIGWIGI